MKTRASNQMPHQTNNKKKKQTTLFKYNKISITKTTSKRTVNWIPYCSIWSIRNKILLKLHRILNIQTYYNFPCTRLNNSNCSNCFRFSISIYWIPLNQIQIQTKYLFSVHNKMKLFD